jgi:hypothetical protein
MAAHLQQARAVLGSLQPEHLATMDQQGIYNLMWAWAAFLPPAPAAPVTQLVSAGQVLLQACAQRWQQDSRTVLRVELLQLHTAVMEARERGLGLSTAAVPSSLLDAAEAAWVGARDAGELSTDADGFQSGFTSSSAEGKVHAALQALGYTAADGQEAVTPGTKAGTTGMRADALLTRTPSGQPCCVAFEFDGPSHYLQHPREVQQLLDGATVLRNQQLGRRVDHLLCIPWGEWRDLKGSKQAQQAYLQRRLAEAGVAA